MSPDFTCLAISLNFYLALMQDKMKFLIKSNAFPLIVYAFQNPGMNEFRVIAIAIIVGMLN